MWSDGGGVEMGMVNKIDKEVTLMLIIVSYYLRAHTLSSAHSMTGIDIWIMGVPQQESPRDEELESTICVELNCLVTHLRWLF